MSPSVSVVSWWLPPLVAGSRTGMRWRMVIFSGPMRTSLTSRRSTRWRSLDGGGGGAAAQLGEEALEVVGEFEVGVAVGGLGVERGELAAQARFAGAQVRHAGAQFIDGDQLLGVGLDHRGDRRGCLGQRELELFALPGDRVGGAGLGQPAVDLGADQGRVGEQAGDVVPDDGVEVVGADRLVAADPAALVAVVVGAQAPVVVDLLAGGGGRVAR